MKEAYLALSLKKYLRISRPNTNPTASMVGAKRRAVKDKTNANKRHWTMVSRPCRVPRVA
jgi:hypothetical protein